MVEPVSIDTYTPQMEPFTGVSIDVDGRIYNPPVNSEVAKARAYKAAYGIKDKLPISQIEINQSMVSGYEDTMRQQVASQLDVKQAQENNVALTKLASSPSISAEQFQLAVSALDNKPTDPNTVFEKAYGKAYVESIDKAAEGKPSWVPRAQMELGEAYRQVKAVGSDLIAKQQYLRKWAQDIQQNDVGAQSMPGYLADRAKELLQPYTEWKSRGNIPGVGFFQGPLGYNLRMQGVEVLRKPMQEMIETLKPTIEKMRNDNPGLAARYLMQLAGMTSEEEIVNNLFTFMMPLDYAGLASVGKRAISKGGDEVVLGIKTERKSAWEEMMEKATTATKQVVQSAGDEPHTPARMAAVAGDVETAAVKTAARVIDAETKADGPELIAAEKDTLFKFMKIDEDQVTAGPGASGVDGANRVLQAYKADRTRMEPAIVDRSLVDKGSWVFDSEPAVQRLMTHVKSRAEFVGLQSAIDNIVFRHSKLTNNYSYDVIFTKLDGQLFHNIEDAFAWSQLHGLKITNDNVLQQGSQYVIVINKPLKATDSVFRDLLIQTKDQVAPMSNTRAWLGSFINPDETLSVSNREARKIASYGPSTMMEPLKPAAAMIQNFARGATQVNPITGAVERYNPSGLNKRWDQWLRMVKAGRTMPDPDKPGDYGYWFKDVNEIDYFYQTNYHRFPEEAEVAAYFAYKRINEYDRILRSLRWVSNMQRDGAELFNFHYTDKEGVSKQFPDFVATRENKRSTGSGHIIVMKDGTEKSLKIYRSAATGPTIAKEIDRGLEDGSLVLLKNYFPAQNQFAGMGTGKNSVTVDHWVQYLVVPAAYPKPIPLDFLPRRGGGHWDLEHPFYLTQAIIHDSNRTKMSGKLAERESVYGGQRTLMPIQSAAQGRVLEKHFNAMRQMLRDGSPEAAEAYHTLHRKEIGVEFSAFKGWFNKRKDRDGVPQRPFLTLEENIRLVPADKQIIDVDDTLNREYAHTDPTTGITKEGIIDGTKTGNPGGHSKVEYTGIRDSDPPWTINDQGTRLNPLYKYEAAEMVDPIEAMNRAVTRIAQSTYLEDYKQQAVEEWLRQASKYLSYDINELGNGPAYHYFYNMKWRDGADPVAVKQLEATNWNIRQFLGVRSETDVLVQATTQKLLDSVYGKFGPNAVKLIPTWMLSGITDPINFIKQVTYHAALGFGSIPQLVVQAQTWVLTAALSPRAAAASTYATFLHMLTAINPGMVAAMDKWATKLNIPGMHAWKIGEFAEAQAMLRKVGFSNVQGEHAVIDSLMHGNKLVQGAGRTMLDWGAMPFKAGEKFVRINAWYTAFKEFRLANPTGRITDKDLGTILNRADDLYGNMSRASSSSLHTGVLSIPAQFLSYQLRLAELFLGTRTTKADKARMMMFFAAAYGVPTGLSLTGLPLQDYLRKKAIEEGYVVGDNYITDLVMNGIPTMLLSQMTGTDPLNIPERFGPGGITVIRDALRGDKHWAEVVGGPAGGKFAGLIESFDPFWQTMMSAVRQDPDSAFKLKANDLIGPLKEISSISNLNKTLLAVNTGRLISKSGIYLDDVSPVRAIIMGLTGTSPQKVADLNIISWSAKDIESYQERIEKLFKKNFREASRIAEKQPQDAVDYYNRAFVYLHLGGFRDDQLSQIISSAARDYESLVNQMDWSYYIQKAPKNKQEKLFEAFGKKQMVNN